MMHWALLILVITSTGYGFQTGNQDNLMSYDTCRVELAELDKNLTSKRDLDVAYPFVGDVITVQIKGELQKVLVDKVVGVCADMRGKK